MAGRPRSVSDGAVFHAVAEVVTAAGPAGLTLAAVAARVGVSAPALAQRFGSKRELLLAFAASEAGALPAIFEEVRAEASGPLDALTKALVRLIAPITTREGLANNLAFLQLDLTDPDLRAHAVKQSRSFRAEIGRLLAEATERGELEVAGGDIRPLADTVYATYNGALVTWAIDGTGKVALWLTDRVERVISPYRRTDVPASAPTPVSAATGRRRRG